MSALPRDFAYQRAIAPSMWVFVGLATIELLVVHLLVVHLIGGLWSGRAALLLSAISLGAIGWLVAAIASFRRLPVRIADDVLIWRVGWIACRTVPLDRVGGLRQDWDGAALKDRSVLNLALIAYPNILVDLRAPIAGRRGRTIRTLAHRLDDPAAFAAALAPLLAAHDPS